MDENVIDSKLKIYLTVEHPTMPSLYMLSKIHKSVIDPPGRLIVSGRGSILSNIPKFTDQILRPYVTQMKSYIQDTGDFLSKISELTLLTDTLLVSFDVVSLYTSIQHLFLEETVIYGSHYSRYLGWWRFIHDIFLICTRTSNQLEIVHTFLNQINPPPSPLQFTISWSKEKIQFLDKEISLVDNYLYSDLHIKSTDRNTLLRLESCHPKRMVKSLPLS